jgi:multicomponent Na+:H+ antiporter subunit G
MRALLGGFLIGAGAAFMLLAGVGLLRLPDVFARMHAATKSASLGLACVLAGTVLLLRGPLADVKLLMAIAFQFMTAPVAAHIIGRAAYRAGIPLWEGTLFDEWEDPERQSALDEGSG